MKDVWTKFSCHFIGWDYNMLKECSMGSRKTLQRYVGAIILLMLLWFYIGHSMAKRYFGIESVGAQIVVGAVFSLLIWTIERQIILIVGKNRAMAFFRGGLAIVMAALGATIIDQTMFGKDIEAQTQKVIAERASDIFESKKKVSAEMLSQNQKELDSLEIQSSLLLEAIMRQPKITTWKQKITGADSLGNPKYGYEQETEPNPKAQDRERIKQRMEDIQKNMSEIYNAQQGMWVDSEKEAKDNIGLLTELEITFSKNVVFSGLASLLFYGSVFAFFMCIELLVLTGKMLSAPCDYEVLVEYQQEKKRKQICSLLADKSYENI